jgi:hypothetical protein
MRPRLIQLALTATLLLLGSSAAHALTPDDAIYLSQQGVDPEIIIAKICADAEAWDLTAEEIVYLAEEGVSLDVINALIDPVSAAEKWGFTLGEPDIYLEEEDGYYTEEEGYYLGEDVGSSLIFSLGFYYGPLSVHYFSHPYFYPYMYCNGFAFSYSYWPVYYRNYYYPYGCGYYPYPYHAYGPGSYYCGDVYVGHYQHNYYGYHGSRRYAEVGDIRYRDWQGEGTRLAAYRSDKPPYPEIRGESNGRKDLNDSRYRTRQRTDRIDGEKGSRRGDDTAGPQPGDRRVGRDGGLGNGNPGNEVVRTDRGSRREGTKGALPIEDLGRGSRRAGEKGTLATREPDRQAKRVTDTRRGKVSRRTIGTPKKIDLPKRGRTIDSKRSKDTGRRDVALGTTKTEKSRLGRLFEGRSKDSGGKKIARSSGGNSKKISKPTRSKSKKISKPTRSKSKKVSKPSRSGSKKSSSAKISRSSGSSKKAASVKASRSSRSISKSSARAPSSRGRSSAGRSSGRAGGKR